MLAIILKLLVQQRFLCWGALRPSDQIPILQLAEKLQNVLAFFSFEVWKLLQNVCFGHASYVICRVSQSKDVSAFEDYGLTGKAATLSSGPLLWQS